MNLKKEFLKLISDDVEFRYLISRQLNIDDLEEKIEEIEKKI